MNSHSQPHFSIGNVHIQGQVMLAPMDGYTDLPFRLLCRRQGSAAVFSEFINGIDIENGHPHLESKLLFSSDERPFAYQVFDDNPERLLRAALKLQDRKPDFIDVNMGCSARNVSNRGAGAGLLKDTKKIAQIIDLLVRNLKVPVTAKIRLGWDENTRNYMEVSRIIEDNGASALTIHARTRKQEYSGSADWNAIAEIKKSVSIPLIGNGDVRSYKDSQRLISETGCDAVMIGRAAIGNPWIFNGDDLTPDSQDLYNMVKIHLDLITIHYGEKVGILLFRKHLAKYLKNYLITPEIRAEIFQITEKQQLLTYIHHLVE